MSGHRILGELYLDPMAFLRVRDFSGSSESDIRAEFKRKGVDQICLTVQDVRDMIQILCPVGMTAVR